MDPSWLLLLKYDYGRSNAVYDIATEDKTWIYCNMLERTQQSSVWVFEGDSKTTKLRQARSVGKNMIAVFYSKTGPVCTIPLEEQKTVNAEWPEETVVAFSQHAQNMLFKPMVLVFSKTI
ncbi:hypothetical protein EVAR_70783_1 [Eumeta japonica]|uniref:Mariner Mos1 transposase n=1 Tax=Eumeta variegata TaxID=151549 RepID=A0A4C1SH50_EUMVA|nr:hypothetical protein EVAR_70783_1 [Eumeta japonica]